METLTETSPSKLGFGGLRVVALESRMSGETTSLIEKAGGIAISAPSMREVPIGENPRALEFAEALLAGKYDAVVCMTGVGTRYLFAAMETRYTRDDLVSAMSQITVVARGPKPVAVLREFGIPVAVTVPEPNTWREMISAMEEAEDSVALRGALVAVQEYGVSNDRFVKALQERGAKVETVPVYRWELPEDLAPLRKAIAEILARTADVLLVTSATQAYHLLQVAEADGNRDELIEALHELALCSIGPVASEALSELGIAADLEPSRPKLGIFVREAAERTPDIVAHKREQRRSSVETPRKPAAVRDVNRSVFMRACRREPVPYTPVWLMRQAGRYMQEYREVRARIPFIELCKRPDLAAEVAVTAQQRIGADAAILFSDILLIVEPMGLGLEYIGGEGPSITRTIREGADVSRLREVEPADSLAFVFDAVRATRAALDPGVPLLGFSGAPFTLASYIVEGGGSKNYIRTKGLMYSDEGAWHAMMERISRAVAKYLVGQIEAGVQAVQLFDSWVGCLSPADYERYVKRHTEFVIRALPKGTPVIHFGTSCASLLDAQASTGASVLGVDHRVDLAQVQKRFPDLAVQGNLDPVVLFCGRDVIRKRSMEVLTQADGRPGHIFNLGHGVLPATPVDNVVALIDAVHELSERA